MKEAQRRYIFVYLVVVLLGFIAAFFMSRFSVSLGKVIDVVIDPNESLSKAMEICGIMLLIWLLSAFLFDYFEIIYVNKIARFLKHRLYIALFGREMKSFFEVKNGYFLSLYTKDIDLVVDNYLIPKCNVVCNMLSAVVCLISIFAINWKLGVAYVAISVGTVFLSQLPGALMAKKTVDYTEANSRYVTSLENVLAGYEQIKLLNLGKIFMEKLDKEDRQYEKARKNYLYAKISAGDLGKSVGMLSQLLCMAVGIWLALSNSITVGMMIAAVQLLNGVFGPLQLFVQDKNLMGTAEEIIKRIEKNQEMEAVVGDEFAERITRIDFNHIELNFSGKNIFHDYEISFEHGKKYAIVGESGKGKSTLIKLLMKYIASEAYGGSVLLNGRDITSVNPENIYDRIGYIQRNDFLVDGSVEDNILLYRNGSIKKNLENICKRLRLNEAFMQKTIDISNPNEVSYGEKQRIDIARFLLSDYDVLIFDEPTSNLDPVTTSEIYDMIFEIKDKIVIVITHNHSEDILTRFDEVVAL